MTNEEMDYFITDNMNKLKDAINDMHNHYPFNLAKELSDQYKYCDIQKLYDVINNKLRPENRVILILRYRYKFTYTQIEEELKCSPGYVRIVFNELLYRLKNNYDIYVYDKKYIKSYIKDYEQEIETLKTDIDKLKKYKRYLIDQVLKDNPDMSRAKLIDKINRDINYRDSIIY